MVTEAYSQDNATTFERILPFSMEEDQQRLSFLAMDRKVSISEIGSRTIVQNNEIPLTICGKKYTVPYALKSIVEHIEEAKEILDYTYDWDDDGALPTDDKTFGQASHFVLDYVQHIFKNHKTVLQTPYIDVLRDGSVSVHWETQKGKLLIIFKRETKNLAYYYAERLVNNIPFKSAIKIGEEIDEFLALWMEKNLK